jgi:hypothetical protein
MLHYGFHTNMSLRIGCESSTAALTMRAHRRSHGCGEVAVAAAKSSILRSPPRSGLALDTKSDATCISHGTIHYIQGLGFGDERCYKSDRQITKIEKKTQRGTQDFNVENPLQQREVKTTGAVGNSNNAVNPSRRLTRNI